MFEGKTGGNMINRFWFLAFATLTASPAQASDFVLNVVADSGQISTFEQGVELIDDPQAKSVVRIVEPRDATDKHGKFAVLALNRGDVPVNFGPENVVLRLPDGTGVAMLDYTELMRRQKKREKWQAIGLALAAGGRGAAATGYSSGTVNYSGRTSGTYGATPYSGNTTGTATYSGYDAASASAAQSQANEENRRDAQAVRGQQQQARNQIAEIMQTTTVAPRTISGGGLQYDMPKAVRSSKAPVPVTIEITVGDEKHIFHGTLTKR